MAIEDAIDRNTAKLDEVGKLIAGLQTSIAALQDQLNGGQAAKPATTPTKADKPKAPKKDEKPAGVDPRVLADAAQLATKYCGLEAARAAVKEAGGADQFADVAPDKSEALLQRFVDDIQAPLVAAARELFTVDAIKDAVTEANGGTAAKLGDIEPVARVGVYKALRAKIEAAAQPAAVEDDVI